MEENTYTINTGSQLMHRKETNKHMVATGARKLFVFTKPNFNKFHWNKGCRTSSVFLAKQLPSCLEIVTCTSISIVSVLCWHLFDKLVVLNLTTVSFATFTWLWMRSQCIRSQQWLFLFTRCCLYLNDLIQYQQSKREQSRIALHTTVAVSICRLRRSTHVILHLHGY